MLNSTGQHRYIEPDSLDALLRSINIIDVVGQYVTLKKVGSNYAATCPFPDHNEKKPSFYVSESKRLFRCFGCQRSGRAIEFIKEMEGLSFYEAVIFIAERFHFPLEFRDEPGGRSKYADAAALLGHALQFYTTSLAECPRNDKVWTYASSRGLDERIIGEMSLGYAPPGNGLTFSLRRAGMNLALAEEIGLIRIARQDSYADFLHNRLIFPLFGIDNKLIGFGGRTLEPNGQPKYLNPRESFIYKKRNTLYGLQKTKSRIKELDRCVVVEGYMDFVTMFQYGFGNVVAALGTALTASQIGLISRLTNTIVLFFDADAPGKKSMVKNLPLFLNKGINGYVLEIEDGHDPDTYMRKVGLDVLQKSVENPTPLMAFYIKQRLGEEDPEYGRTRVAKELSAMLKEIESPIDLTFAALKVSEYLGIDEKAFIEDVKKTGPALDFTPLLPFDRKFSGPEFDLLRVVLRHEDLCYQCIDDEVVHELPTGMVKRVFEGLIELVSESGKLDTYQLETRLSSQEEKDLLHWALFGPVLLNEVMLKNEYRDYRMTIMSNRIKSLEEDLSRQLNHISAQGDKQLMKDLLERKMVQQKTKPLVETAIKEGDVDQLHRLYLKRVGAEMALEQVQ